MKRIVAAAAALLLLGASEAAAEQAADAVGKCLADSSTGRDRVALVRWIFGAMAKHPDVAGFAGVRDGQHQLWAEQAGAAVSRLILKDCRVEAVAAIATEGEAAFAQAFDGFGRLAMQELMTDPAVRGQIEAIGAGVDDAEWRALMAEAAAARR